MYTCALKLLFMSRSRRVRVLKTAALSPFTPVTDSPKPLYLPHPALQSLLQVNSFEGFGQVIVHARRQAGFPVALQCIGCQGDDGDVGAARQLADLPGGF